MRQSAAAAVATVAHGSATRAERVGDPTRRSSVHARMTLMPLLRCTEPECGHSWFERSHLADDSSCERCGEPTQTVGVDDDLPAELVRSNAVADDPAHPGHARAKARDVARRHGFTKPPVVPHSVARAVGIEVRSSHRLGTLSGRLAGDVIEVNADEPAVRQRFTVAHELGHHFLGTRHGAGEAAEQEADAFAGELLVPGPMLRAAMEQTTDASTLRRLFKVSGQVLQIAAEHHKLAGRLTDDRTGP